MLGCNLVFWRYAVGRHDPIVLRDVVLLAELLGSPPPISQASEVDGAGDRKSPMQRTCAACIRASCAMQLQKRFLKAILGLGSAHRQPQTEAKQAWRDQLVELIEDRVVAVRIALHEMAKARRVGMHGAGIHGTR